MGRWKNRLIQLFDLPSDVTSAETRIEWINNSHLQIENHQGIQSFNANELKVLVKNQVLSISGSQLHIKSINAYIVLITGKIDQIRYIPQRG